MGLKELTESKGYKNFMSKLYGIGASVVILGALFKIQHWPGAGIMLTLGLTTEAIIFFASAFEPLHVMPDWSLVYPELWGLYHEGEPHPDGYEFDEKGRPLKPISKSTSISQELDKMLQEAKIDSALIQSLSEGMRNLSDNALKLSAVATAAGATDAFVSHLHQASESVQKLTAVYDKTSESLAHNIQVSESLASSMRVASESAQKTGEAFQTVAQNLKEDIHATGNYVESIKMATQSMHNLIEKYQQTTESLTKSAQAIDFSQIDAQSYGSQIQQITKNLSALNAIYELQLKELNAQIEQLKQMDAAVNNFVNNMQASASSISKYKEQADLLASNLSALNTVYGNILAAMNVNINR